ncbi:MAG: ABC transporter ATP-binding protein [Beijerinckiaceae bacterium]|nr:ABC transporter ATP-binding protein [Beijerinckiaceae bacterium]
MDQVASAVAETPLVAMRGVVKTFGSLVANDSIDIDIAPGEAHALLGENGAGKSTLVKMLYGLLQPTSGRILWRGEPIVLPDPKAARRRGVGMVFQHFSLFDAMTVAENVALALDGDEPASVLADRLAQVSRAYGLPLEPGRQVWSLPVGERQRIEIVRCLMQNPQLLILDEPTSVLTPQETVGLFATLERVRAEGRSVLYISHKLEEVRAVCERATILRHGKVVAACDPRKESAGALARMMVGADVGAARREAAPSTGRKRIEVRALSMPAPDEHGVALHDISFDVRGGEIVGIAGVAGNGQGELFDALSGERLATGAGSIRLDDAEVSGAGVNARRKRGAAFVPEERLGHATAPGLSLTDNAIVSGHATNGFVRRGFLDRPAALAWVDRVVKEFDVRKGPRDPAARALSGGNLQKFIVGRELLRAPGVLVISQPTWGVDAGAAQMIRQALVDRARAGAAILVISRDLDELFEISDRIAVMFHGRLSAPQPAHGMTREAVGLLMGGAGFEPGARVLGEAGA